jgi:3-deoxy-D-manno-octulosonate 8-phosphate phosphatase (KDO 8-P phosphatase)
MLKPLAPPEVFVLDVDGVLTDGKFTYTEQGKVSKVFGPDDNDALQILKKHMRIIFVSGDKRGFEISRVRIVDHMGFPLHLVSTINRLDWIRERFDPSKVVYMGDGIFDYLVMKSVRYSIAPSNADSSAKKHSSYTTSRAGSERAVSEACIHLMDKFFIGLEQSLNSSSEDDRVIDWTV